MEAGGKRCGGNRKREDAARRRGKLNKRSRDY